MSEVKKLLFIVNKHAGPVFQEKLEGRIIDEASKYNIECSIEFTKSRGHATELAKEGVEKKFNTIVSVGGDGTINEVANGLVHSAVPMGILPMGSGNGLARHLGISLKLNQALIDLFTGQELTMDTFLMNGKLSLNVSGIGFDGHVSNLFGKNKQRGFWGYLKLVVNEYLNYPEFESELFLDEENSSKKAFIIAIANSSQYGNNAKISPHASISDNMLNVVFLRKMNLHKGLPFAYKMFTGKLADDTDSMEIHQSIRLSTSKPISYHIDGEPCGKDSEFNIQLQPQSLKIIIPSRTQHKI